jgi:hypothetical protein
VREKEETDKAMIKESEGQCTTASARNEYQVVDCIVVLDSAGSKRCTYEKRFGRNKSRSARPRPSI